MGTKLARAFCHIFRASTTPVETTKSHNIHRQQIPDVTLILFTPTSVLFLLQLHFLCRERAFQTKNFSVSHLRNHCQTSYSFDSNLGRCAMREGYKLETSNIEGVSIISFLFF